MQTTRTKILFKEVKHLKFAQEPEQKKTFQVNLLSDEIHHHQNYSNSWRKSDIKTLKTTIFLQNGSNKIRYKQIKEEQFGLKLSVLQSRRLDGHWILIPRLKCCFSSRLGVSFPASASSVLLLFMLQRVGGIFSTRLDRFKWLVVFEKHSYF